MCIRQPVDRSWHNEEEDTEKSLIKAKKSAIGQAQQPSEVLKATAVYVGWKS